MFCYLPLFYIIIYLCIKGALLSIGDIVLAKVGNFVLSERSVDEHAQLIIGTFHWAANRAPGKQTESHEKPEIKSKELINLRIPG